MAEVPQIPLKEFLKLFAPTYVLGTTYTISLAFFEALVFPEISRKNLRRCLILCDKVGFQRATVESSALRSAGREYMAICAPAFQDDAVQSIEALPHVHRPRAEEDADIGGHA